jgi:hypothetical protein
MVNSPISIPLTPSLSRNPSDLVKTQAIAAAALRIEHYINSQMDRDYIREFDFAALAVELSMDQDRVCGLLSKLAGNEIAITICNPQKRPKAPRPGRARSSGGQDGQTTDAPSWNESVSTASEVRR